jgi:hypothetical protein
MGKNEILTEKAGIYKFRYGEDILAKPRIIKRYFNNKMTLGEVVEYASKDIEKIPIKDFHFSVPDNLSLKNIEVQNYELHFIFNR